MKNKLKKREEKQKKLLKEKEIPKHKKPKCDRYWYDPDCGPIYPD